MNRDNHIYEYFAELTKQVDLRRERLIEGIHDYLAELIQQIETLKHECMTKSKPAKNLDEIKTELANWNQVWIGDGKEIKRIEWNDGDIFGEI